MERVNELITQLNQPNLDETSFELILSQIRDIFTHPSHPVLLRDPACLPLLEQAIHSPLIEFRRLAYFLISQQIPKEGATQWIISLTFIETIINAVNDSDDQIAATANKILKSLGLSLLLNEQYSVILNNISRTSDTAFLRIFSVVFSIAAQNRDSLIKATENQWIARVIEKISFDPSADILVTMNLLELITELLKQVIENNVDDLYDACWSVFHGNAMEICQLLIKPDGITFFSLLIDSLMELTRLYGLIYFKVQNTGKLELTHDFTQTLITTYEKYSSSADQNNSFVILGISSFACFEQSQKRFLENEKLVKLYSEALWNPNKMVILNFILSITRSIQCTKGNHVAETFCKRFLGEKERDRILGFAQACSEWLERLVVYQLLQQLAACSWGRILLFNTMGLLVWLSDRSLIIQPNPECTWRYSILQQLVTDLAQTREYIGDTGYLRIREYLSQGEYYSERQAKAIVAEETF